MRMYFNKIMVFLLTGVIAFSYLPAYASNNPGIPANHCIKAENTGKRFRFENQCSQPAFVFYCGDLQYSNKKCGAGESYYTHGMNLKPGAADDVAINGNLRWGACFGSKSFGHDEFSDFPDGSFVCKNEQKKKEGKEDTTKSMQDQRDKLNQLEQLDRQDHLAFMALYDKANSCSQARDFDCAAKALSQAAKYAVSAQDKHRLKTAQENLAAVRNDPAREEQAQRNKKSGGSSKKRTTSVASGPSSTACADGTRKKKVIYGPEQLEAVAVCWQSKHNANHWRCDGPIQDTIMYDDTVESQLGYVGCENPRATDGTRSGLSKSHDDGTAVVYLCGYGIVGSDYDVVKKYGLTVQRNKYQCTGSKYETSHCRDIFQLTHQATNDVEVCEETPTKEDLKPDIKGKTKGKKEQRHLTKEQERVEQEFWEQAKAENSLQSYNRYMEAYPNGRYTAYAKAAILKLQREAIAREKREAERNKQEARQQKLAAERARREAAEREKAEAVRIRQEAKQRRLAEERAKREAAQREKMEAARIRLAAKQQKLAEERARREAIRLARQEEERKLLEAAKLKLAQEKATREAARLAKKEAAQRKQEARKQKLAEARDRRNAGRSPRAKVDAGTSARETTSSGASNCGALAGKWFINVANAASMANLGCSFANDCSVACTIYQSPVSGTFTYNRNTNSFSMSLGGNSMTANGTISGTNDFYADGASTVCRGNDCGQESAKFHFVRQ